MISVQGVYYDIVPVSKPRMTQRDKWKPAAKRYYSFCNEVRKYPHMAYDNGWRITFVIPMPKSWSKKKKDKFDLTPHLQQPDLDNYVKALLDALFDDDKHIWNISARKLWGYKPGIWIEPNFIRKD